jgi:hypothetical protein
MHASYYVSSQVCFGGLPGVYGGEWKTNLAGRSLVSLDAPKLHVKPCGSDRKLQTKVPHLDLPLLVNEVN